MVSSCSTAEYAWVIILDATVLTEVRYMIHDMQLVPETLQYEKNMDLHMSHVVKHTNCRSRQSGSLST